MRAFRVTRALLGTAGIFFCLPAFVAYAQEENSTPTTTTAPLPTAPALTVPTLTVPTLQVPSLPTPGASGPAVPTAPTLPTVTLPPLPTLPAPSLQAPSLPQLSVPALQVPELKVPELPVLTPPTLPAPVLPALPQSGSPSGGNQSPKAASVPSVGQQTTPEQLLDVLRDGKSEAPIELVPPQEANTESSRIPLRGLAFAGAGTALFFGAVSMFRRRPVDPVS